MPALDIPQYYPKNHGQDLTDWFVRHGRSVSDLTDLLVTAITVDKPAEPDIDPGVLRFYKGRKFMPALLAKAIMEDLSIISDPVTGLVYRWEGRFWKQFDLSYIRSKALQMLGDEGNSAKAADVANMIRDLSTLPDGRKLNDHDDLVCLESGMFNLVTGDLLKHDKDYYATSILPINFDPKIIQLCPTFDSCLDQWVGDRASIKELVKYMGYCLTRDTRYEKMLLLYGPGGDGKSTFMSILQELVGEDNCSHIPMERLDDQFYLSRLVDKLVNMYTEVEQKAMQSNNIKAIVSGDWISASFKNQTPFDFKPKCKLIYSTNRLIKMLDNSDGYFRKIMVIKFEGQFVKAGKANLSLRDDLLKELPGIFAKALWGLVELRKEGFRESQTMAETIKEYKQINNNVLYFIEKHVVADPAGKELKTSSGNKNFPSAYEVYVDRCRGWNLPPFGEPHFQKEFARLLRDLGVEVGDGKKSIPINASGDTKRANCYMGFTLVDEKLEADSPAPSPAPLSPEARHE